MAYCWWFRNPKQPRSVKPCKWWDELHVNWCRISSINSIFKGYGSFRGNTVFLDSGGVCLDGSKRLWFFPTLKRQKQTENPTHTWWTIQDSITSRKETRLVTILYSTPNILGGCDFFLVYISRSQKTHPKPEILSLSHKKIVAKHSFWLGGGFKIQFIRLWPFKKGHLFVTVMWLVTHKHKRLGGGSKEKVIFTPILGEDAPMWQLRWYFSDGLSSRSTTNELRSDRLVVFGNCLISACVIALLTNSRMRTRGLCLGEKTNPLGQKPVCSLEKNKGEEIDAKIVVEYTNLKRRDEV